MVVGITRVDLLFKPAILGMWLLTMQPNPSHVTDLNGPAVELQTSVAGLGAHVMVSSRSFLGAGIHYGFRWSVTDHLSVVAQPFAGMSHAIDPMPELPLRTQFEVGLTLVATYRQYVAGAKYWHASNAGLHARNAGVDVVGPVVGVQF